MLPDCWAHEEQIPRNTLCFFVCQSVRFSPESLIEIFQVLFVFPYVKLVGIFIKITPSIMKIDFGTKFFWKDVCSAVNWLL